MEFFSVRREELAVLQLRHCLEKHFLATVLFFVSCVLGVRREAFTVLGLQHVLGLHCSACCFYGIHFTGEKNWLFSRYSTGWKCGLHPDWTELVGCVDIYLKVIFDPIPGIKATIELVLCRCTVRSSYLLNSTLY